MRCIAAAQAILFSTVLFAGPPAPVCAECHPAAVIQHQRTRMAHAMMPVAESPFAQHVPGFPLSESPDGYQFTYRTTRAALAVSAARGNDKAEGLIEWVLGAGVQGQTPLIRAANGTSESRVSYFPKLGRYGITIGQPPGASASALASLGYPKNNHDLKACVACHASALNADLTPAIPGVQCQTCHPGSEEHAKGLGKVINPGKMTALQQVQFCGNCHRTTPPVDDTQLENVRFQPLRLMKSRCFASGQLACLTCHPAHQDARRDDPAFYNAKCQTCHSAKPAHADVRQNGDCIGCHMPNVELHPALKFTDHYIRIVKRGDTPADLIRQRPAAE